jgi:hypothetical protein
LGRGRIPKREDEGELQEFALECGRGNLGNGLGKVLEKSGVRDARIYDVREKVL